MCNANGGQAFVIDQQKKIYDVTEGGSNKGGKKKSREGESFEKERGATMSSSRREGNWKVMVASARWAPCRTSKDKVGRNKTRPRVQEGGRIRKNLAKRKGKTMWTPYPKS